MNVSFVMAKIKSVFIVWVREKSRCDVAPAAHPLVLDSYPIFTLIETATDWHGRMAWVGYTSR